MKLKKLLLGIAMVASIAILSSCGDKPKEAPKITKVTAYNYNNEVVPFENGDVMVDPSLRYLMLTFDREMYGSWSYTYSNKYKSGEYIIDKGWVNAYTFLFVFNLSYSADIVIDFNDPESLTDDFTKEYWFRDKNGNYLDKYSLQFSTKPSPNADKKMTYEFDVNEKINEDLLIDLTYNKYGTPPNLQTGLSIKELILPETLKPGDVVKVKYKLYADEDLPEIVVNLVDVSEAAGYWTVLAKEEDQLLTAEKYIASETDEPNYYYGELTFNITKAMTTTCTIQFTCNEVVNPTESDVVQFTIPAN